MQFFQNRFTARIVLAGLAGAAAPLAVVGPYLLTRPQGVDWTVLTMLALTTAVGAIVTSVRLRREARPVVRISHALRGFADSRAWHPVPCYPHDEIGRLSSAAQKVTATVAALESQCEEAMHRDALTGLPSRPAFLKDIAGRPLGCLALIGIDRLREVNDLYGHETGDDALRGFAAAMAGTLGPDDMLARWSGKQFILYLDEPDPDRACETVERMRRAFASTMVIECRRVTFSAGVVAMSGDIDIDTAAAEELLHTAKRTGRNRVMTPMLAIAGGAGELRDLAETFDTELLRSGS